MGQWPLIKFKVVVLSCDIFTRAGVQRHVYTICQISKQVFTLSKHWCKRSKNKWREKVKPHEQRIFINVPWFIHFCYQSMSHWVAINANGADEWINCWRKTPTPLHHHHHHHHQQYTVPILCLCISITRASNQFDEVTAWTSVQFIMAAWILHEIC